MSLQDTLKAEIERDGPVGIDRWMTACNQHYYGTRDPLGQEGDFTTAPEISQMFGELVGAALADAWLRAGAPVEAVYAELGPGRGTLASDALRLLAKARFEGGKHLVETSPVLREMQAKAVPGAVHHVSIEDLPTRPLLCVANEFFDALPTRQFGPEGERKVQVEAGRFTYTTSHVDREESPEREATMASLARHLVANGGVALVIDYGFWEGGADTLQAMRAHDHADPLADPGENDLTTHVDFGALAKAAAGEGASLTRMIAQGSWLENLGIGARAMALAAANPDRTEAIAADRRRLCDEAQMGTLFKVMAVHAPGWPAPAGFPA
ncbi:class I SAM-dependent methyltransferase [Sphingomicrobium nitratireducens]|uniref:class I SAM-dependent methyltransferase n=1 Tax=Sphingomicrobium nitratireducens TaxID=2964666 RepID=UPI00223F5E6E|nr:SAM-dependent methyltransferase [Sphingomicrobium nitratireducens]